MAHQYEDQDATATAKGAHRAKAAWHGLGATITDPDVVRSVPLFAEKANMRHTVAKIPAYRESFGVDADGSPVAGFAPVPGAFWLERSDGRIVSSGTVSGRYTVVQVTELQDVAAPFVAAGFATVDSMFSLYDGGSDVVSLRLDLQQDVLGDDSRYEHYMVLQNFHGRGALRGKLTSVRVVCHNTTSAAFGTKGKGSADFALRHTASVQDQLAFAVSTWEQVREHLARQAAILGRLATHDVDVAKVVADILGVVSTSSTRLKNQAEEVTAYARGASPGTRGKTALDVWHAFTFWTTHSAEGRSGAAGQSGIVESLLDGDRARKQARAAEVLGALVGAV